MSGQEFYAKVLELAYYGLERCHQYERSYGRACLRDELEEVAREAAYRLTGDHDLTFAKKLFTGADGGVRSLIEDLEVKP